MKIPQSYLDAEKAIVRNPGDAIPEWRCPVWIDNLGIMISVRVRAWTAEEAYYGLRESLLARLQTDKIVAWGQLEDPSNIYGEGEL